MARPSRLGSRPRRRLIAGVAGAVGVATLVGLAVTAQGYDERELPKVETSVWVSRDSGRYARVNTTLGEIDTIRSVQDPSTIVQSGADGVVFGQGFGSLWPIDSSEPADLVGADDETEEDATAAGGGSASATPDSTPPGTRAVVVAGDHLLLLTDLGEVFLGSVAAAAAGDAAFAQLDPLADEEPDADGTRVAYSASTATVSADGVVVMYSAQDGAVRRYDAGRGAFVGEPEAIERAPGTAAAVSITMVGDRWAMLQPGTQLLWVQGRPDPVEVDVDAAALIQRPGPARDAVAIADESGLHEFAVADGAPVRAVSASGTPARPTTVDGALVAAWVGVAGGFLWNSDTGLTTALQTEQDVLAELDEIIPMIRSNGDRAVLNETASGMLWTIPDGVLIPVSAWEVDDDEETETGTVVVDDATEQEPPVAVDDAFGVRAGTLVSLPVLFNDSDPNRGDVLTIVPDALGPLADPAFGTLGLVGGDQTATVLVAAGAGSTEFSYRVTDGVAASEPATVRLTVVPPEQNTAPVWCGVEGCTQTWPSPELAPGGSIVVPVLDGWVDAEGDPFVLSDVEVVSGGDSIVAVPTGDGRVAVRHLDPNGAPGEVVLLVTVVDALGAAAQRELSIGISASPALELRSSVVVATAGEPARLEVADVVVGGSGAFRLTEAVDASAVEGTVSVIPNAADGAIELSSATPGEYRISFTVLDTLTSTERTSTARFSVQPVGSRLALPPLTAFVRPGEDTTVGVLDAVQSTSGRVLVVASAVSDRPELAAAVVDQSTVRVRGTTADGLAGPIGTVSVLVTDGAGTTTTGTITVFLAPVEREVAPIALPDSITVRAGEQVDIPVLANDVGARGERLVVHPSVVGSGAPGELAFAAGSLVRYLAPEAPGVYTLGYSARSESSPALIASTTVTVTVLADGANRPPQPRALTARAVAGTTVEIPVPSFGVDPDGDTVVLTGVDQPSAGLGSASVSASGDSILYRAPAAGVEGGQVSFGYQVRDSAGATASGTVRVGVIDADLADLTPITYSNHVRVQVGAAEAATVMPLADDRDPAQGSLELIALEPNVAGGPGDAEYDRLAALVAGGTDLDAGVVSLLPGDVVGTHSYVYTVRSTATTSTAEGLIVVTVGRDAAPDAPVVADTVIGLADRHLLESGIDVVTGRVQWASGDAGDLELSVWGAADGRWSASGSTISGPVPTAGALVPFELRGLDANGSEAVAYGFLRIPALDDMRVQPTAGFGPLSVDEDRTVRFDPLDAVAIGPRDELELDAAATLPVQRAAASCRVDGDEVVYAAGREAPWTDTCAIRVRVAGQQAWTVVAVPIVVVPDEPRAVLQSIGRTIAPGATDTVDLYADLTSWESGRVGERSQLVYEIAHSGTAFVVTREGDRLLAQATAGAVPGTKETVRVTVAAFGGLSSSITLTVGAAAVDAPRGAGVARTCTVTDGSCVIQVTGAGGEYDPFAGTPGSGLRVVGVGDGGGTSTSCEVATISVASDSTLSATWPNEPKPNGGTCTVPFTVVDAQGRKGLGQLSLEVRGFPDAPSSVTTVDYSATSVTLEVALGGAAQAKPALTGVTILEGGANRAATCSPSGAAAYRCVVSGLVNGEQHAFTARAVNEVGDSLDTAAHTTWSYQAPSISSLTSSTIRVDGRTSAATGVVEVRIGSASDALSFRVVETGTVVPRTGDTTIALLDLPAGAPTTLQVLPTSRFSPPIGTGGEGGTMTTTVTPAGFPIFPGGADASTSSDGTSATVSIPAVGANGSTLGTTTLYAASTADNITCAESGSGAPVASGSGLRTSSSPTITGLTPNTPYWFAACATNGFGHAKSSVVAKFTFVDPSSPGGATYSVDAAASGGGASWSWNTVSVSGVSAPAGAYTRFTIDGAPSTTLDASSFTPGSVPAITAQYCIDSILGTFCGAAETVSPAGAAPTTMWVEFPTGCPAAPIASGTPAPAVSISGGGVGAADVVTTTTEDVLASTVTYDYALTWIGAYAGLTPPAPYQLVCPLT